MPTIRGSASLAAAAQINVLQGNQYEFLPFAARVEFAVSNVAAGLLCTIYSGSDVLMQQAAPSVKAAGTLQYPYDFLLDDVAAAGERLNVQFNNPTAGAIVYDFVVKITPL